MINPKSYRRRIEVSIHNGEILQSYHSEKTDKAVNRIIQGELDGINSFREEMKSKGINEYYRHIKSFHLMT